MTNVLKIVVAALVFATVGIVGIQLIGDNSYDTLVSAESINSSTYGTAVQLANRGLVADSESVYNSSKTFTNANYTMNNALGTITFKAGTSPGYNITNNTLYSINYRYGAVDSTTKTLMRIAISIVIIIAVMLLVLREAGYKFKL